MSGEVVGLRGAPVVRPGEPNQKLVERLEMLLEEARAGKIIGMAYATVIRAEGDPLGNWRGSGWETLDGTTHTLAAGVMALHFRYGHMLAEDDL